MKNIITQLGMLSVIGLMLGSCAQGPSGPDPGQELVVSYTEGTLNIPVNLRKTCDFIIQGTAVGMTSSFTQSSSYENNTIRFLAKQQPSPLDKPTIILHMGSSNPSAGSSQTWQEGTNMIGAEIFFNGNTYMPVEGKTKFNEVSSNGGQITRATGWFNGKLRAANGDELVLESAVFHHPRP